MKFFFCLECRHRQTTSDECERCGSDDLDKDYKEDGDE